LEGHVRISQVIAVACLMSLCAVVPAHAEKRVALVIGNGAYRQPTNLPTRLTTRAACATR
jgi:hypothetical protein